MCFCGVSLRVIKVEISLPFKQYLLSTCLVPGTGLNESAAVNKGTPPPAELLVCQENVIGNDNTYRGLPSAVRKRQDEIGHIPARAGRWPLPQLSLPKGIGDTKAEEHHTEVLEGGTTGRKTPGKWGFWGDRDRRWEGGCAGSSAVTQKASGWHWKGLGNKELTRPCPSSLGKVEGRFQPFLLKMLLKIKSSHDMPTALPGHGYSRCLREQPCSILSVFPSSTQWTDRP